MIVLVGTEAQVHYQTSWAHTIQIIKDAYATTPFDVLNCYGTLFQVSSQEELDLACNNISSWEEA